MRYNISNSNGLLGIVDSNAEQGYLETVLNACYGNVDIVEVSTEFISRLYVYKYVNGNHRDIICLGQVDTNLKILAIWDILFQVFNNDESSGIFVRKEKIC